MKQLIHRRRRSGHASLAVALAVSMSAAALAYLPRMSGHPAQNARRVTTHTRTAGEALFRAALRERSTQNDGKRIVDGVVERIQNGDKQIFDDLQEAAYRQDRPAVALVLAKAMNIAKAAKPTDGADCGVAIATYVEPFIQPLYYYDPLMPIYAIYDAASKQAPEAALHGANLAIEHLANRIVDLAAD